MTYVDLTFENLRDNMHGIFFFSYVMERRGGAFGGGMGRSVPFLDPPLLIHAHSPSPLLRSLIN